MMGDRRRAGWGGWCFVFSRQRMRGLMGNGYRTFYPRSAGKKKQSRKKINVSFQSSKIFPPTPDDLPTEGNPAESETATEEAPAVVSENTTTTTSSEPQSKKLKTSTTAAEDLDKDDDWEAVEKPTASEETAATAAATDVSEGEGEKVEAVESDGEKIEKPVIDAEGKQKKAGAVQLEKNMLAKDW